MQSIQRTAMSLLAASLSSAAFAHNHITVDTKPTPDGPQAVVRAGFYPAETMFTIVDGRLLMDGAIAVYEVPDQLTSGPQAGWYVGDEVLLTTDFFYATGRLNGGNFRWELASVTPVSGGPAVAAWGDFDEIGEFAASALSDGADRAARSFDTFVGYHDHEQGYAFSAAGVYDVTLIVWDSNSVYRDAEPVTVRFNVGAVPCSCVADFDGSGGTPDASDIDAFFTAWLAGDATADADCSGGTPDASDINTFFVQWLNGGC